MSDYYQFKDETGTPIDYYQLVDDNNNLCKEIERLNQKLNQRTKQYENALKRYQDLETKNAQTEYNNKKAIEYINKFDDIKAYYEYVDEDGYNEYNFDEDFKKYMLEILEGDNK